MSSIDPTAYDALGRIMASGGEMALALAMARGYSDARISQIMLRKFGDDWNTAGGALGGFASGMIVAGALANERLESGGSLDISEVPLNGFADTGEYGPARFRWAADVFFEGASSAVTVYGYGSSADPKDLTEDAVNQGDSIVDKYRSKFGLGEGETLTPLAVQFTAIERQY
jgi:hypothetical protein